MKNSKIKLMANVIFPKLKPVPQGSTKDDRKRMFDEYRAEMVMLNPSHFNTDGTYKSLWQWLKAITPR